MKHLWYIALLASLLWGCGPAPEANEAPMPMVEDAREANLDDLATADPNPERVQPVVHQKRASEKMSDFVQLTNLVLDGTQEAAFREQARSMALGLFAPDSMLLVGFDFVGLADGSYAGASSLLDALQQAGWTLRPASSADDGVSEPPIVEGIALMTPVVFEQAATGTRLVGWLDFDKQVQQVDKSFGAERQQVWEVYLSRIAFNPS